MKTSRLQGHLAVILSCLAAASGSAGARADERPGDDVALGRYLVQTSGCNDCHSPGYTQHGGQTAEASWLTGDKLGWRGPWGTTYPSNLRLFVGSMTEAQWLRHARTMEPRPPMPWFNLRAMSDTDLRAIYRYIKAAGPAGLPAPAFVPPGQPVTGPVIQFP
ncbi:MAG TPA: c-type cytochrome [Albitalea sp.]|nr:c-type cytochrome [Albitalea sp.]